MAVMSNGSTCFAMTFPFELWRNFLVIPTHLETRMGMANDHQSLLLEHKYWVFSQVLLYNAGLERIVSALQVWSPAGQVFDPIVVTALAA